MSRGPAPPSPLPPPPELPSPQTAAAGGSSLGAPTLTTPTLTPTTLRNIEQMFAESDPHEPPHHHLNAAGFVPPIVSPTSGNSYAPLGFPASLSLTRQIKSEPSLRVAQNLVVDLKPPPALLTSRPQTLSLVPTESLTRPDSLGPLTRPTSLSLARPDTLTLVLTDTSPLAPSSSSSSLSLARPNSLPLSRPQTLPVPLSHQTLAVSPSLLNGGGGGGGGGLPARNIEFLDKFLKAAASSPLLNTPVVSAINTLALSPVKRETVYHLPVAASSSRSSPPPYPSSSSPPSSPTSSSFSPPILGLAEVAINSSIINGTNQSAGEVNSSGGGGFTERFQEDVKRAVRRERNKQAAARCRKRRLDLISSLQDEVTEWESKVKSLKDELMQLEGQKKGLELVLTRHTGPCRIDRNLGTGANS